MAHFKKNTEHFVLRPETGLVNKLKELAAKIKHPTHNQLAIELMEAGLNMVLDEKPAPSIPENVVIFRGMLKKPTIHPQTESNQDDSQLQREGEDLKIIADLVDTINEMNERLKILEKTKKPKANKKP